MMPERNLNLPKEMNSSYPSARRPHLPPTSQVWQCPRPISSWRFLSFFGIQVNWLLCNLSSLMGLTKVVIF